MRNELIRTHNIINLSKKILLPSLASPSMPTISWAESTHFPIGCNLKHKTTPSIWRMSWRTNRNQTLESNGQSYRDDWRLTGFGKSLRSREIWTIRDLRSTLESEINFGFDGNGGAIKRGLLRNRLLYSAQIRSKLELDKSVFLWRHRF